MAHCASLNLLAVCDRLNDRVVLLNTSTTSPELSFACSTRGEDQGGQPQLFSPNCIAEHNGLLFIQTAAFIDSDDGHIVVLSIQDNGRGVRFERSMCGQGALAAIKPSTTLASFAIHGDSLYVAGEEHLGVLSLNGVLRQKIRLPLPRPFITWICVDDKHAYVNLMSKNYFGGGGV